MVEKHLRRPDVLKLTGLSTTTIYDLMREGKFPRPIKLTGRAVAWPETAIANWLQSRPAA
jgi:prophage regulatory protein